MHNLSKAQRGITGPESAIVLIAFVAVSSGPAFATLSSSLISSDQSKRTMWDAVFRYAEDGTFLGSSPLNSENESPQGITTEDSNFWTTDKLDQKVYKYSMSGTFVSSFALEGSNSPDGLTTEGSNFWVVYNSQTEVSKYDMSGTFIPTFFLAAPNSAPRGITVSPR